MTLLRTLTLGDVDALGRLERAIEALILRRYRALPPGRREAALSPTLVAVRTAAYRRRWALIRAASGDERGAAAARDAADLARLPVVEALLRRTGAAGAADHEAGGAA